MSSPAPRERNQHHLVMDRSNLNYETLRLRPYQLAAQQAIVEARKRGCRAQLVSLATGLGKTVVIATLPKLLELRATDVTLVVAHRDDGPFFRESQRW